MFWTIFQKSKFLGQLLVVCGTISIENTRPWMTRAAHGWTTLAAFGQLAQPISRKSVLIRETMHYSPLTECRGLFFLPHHTRPGPKKKKKTPDFTLTAQSKLGPVICSNRKVRGNGFKPLKQAQEPSQPTCTKSTSAAIM